MQYINPSESQAWSATGGTYHTLSCWNRAQEAQPIAAYGYWAPCPFNAISNWRNDDDAWCQENWLQCTSKSAGGKENKNSTRSPGAARSKKEKQRRKPVTVSPVKVSQCTSRCQQPSYSKPAVAEATSPAPAAEPVSETSAASQDSAPPLLPEHLSLLAPFLSSNVDSGSWRATCQDAKEALLPNGPYSAMLSPAGQAALIGLEKRKKLQDILVNARKLVSGLNFAKLP